MFSLNRFTVAVGVVGGRGRKRVGARKDNVQRYPILGYCILFYPILYYPILSYFRVGAPKGSLAGDGDGSSGSGHRRDASPESEWEAEGRGTEGTPRQ